ncbi:MAG: protein kinase [bacterium]
MTATGMVCGTPAYMAPEQAQNETLDSRADLYALGVIFFEMVSGWPPFSGTNSLQVMIKHIQESPPQLRSLIPGGSLPNSVEDLASELMSKSREKRPTTARAVRERIEAIQREMHLDRVPSEAGMTFDQVVDAWLLPKLPNGESAPSGPTQGLRRETDVERYLTKIDDDKPTNVYPFETKDEIYPTTPLQNPDIIKADRVKVRAGDPDPFAATGVMLQTPEATQAPTAPLPPKTETNPEARPHTDSTIESNRPKEINADRSLSVIAIGIGVVTLIVCAGVFYLFWASQQKHVEPAPTPVVVAAPTPVAVPKPVGPVIDLARANVQFALRDGSNAQGAVKSGQKPARPKPDVKHVANPQPTITKDPTPKPPKEGLSEDAIFGNGSLRKDH